MNIHSESSSCLRLLSTFIARFAALLFAAVAFTSCDELEDLIKKNQDPDSVKEGIVGIWEVAHIDAGPDSIKVFDRESRSWKTIVETKYDFKVEKNGPFYALIKFTDSEMVMLQAGSALPKFELATYYPYSIIQDSILSCKNLHTFYEQSSWTAVNMKHGSFTLKCVSSGPLISKGENSDTISIRSNTLIQLKRVQ